MGTVRSSTSRPTGIIIAPPIPCSTRAPTSMASDCDSPHSTEPRVNSTMAVRNVVREPNRSAAWPLAGMNTARLSR